MSYRHSLRKKKEKKFNDSDIYSWQEKKVNSTEVTNHCLKK